MKVAFLSLGSPFDKRAWSGIPYYALRALGDRGWDIDVIDTPRLDAWLARGIRLTRWGSLPAREPLVGAHFSRLVGARLARRPPDVVVAVNADHKIAALAARWPTVAFNDAVFGPLTQFYPRYATLSRRVMAHGDAQQRALIASPAALLLSSDWAVRAAAAYHGVPEGRFRVVPMGPNFDTPPAASAPSSTKGPLSLLFVGRNWERKGGPIVIDAFTRLRRRFPDARLHVVGCDPAEARGLPGVVVHGGLDKSDPRAALALEDLYREATLFFMPSRQECSAIVYCEACAHGLPSVAADTGGTATLVVNDVNGLLLPLAAGGEAFAEAIAALWRDPDRLTALRAGARAAFETRLNWSAWGDVVEAEVRRVTGG